MRYYVVMGRNGGRKGALTQRLPVPLRPAPPAPPQPTSTLAENYVELAWTAPPGLPKPVHKGTARRPPRPERREARPRDRCTRCRARPEAPPVAPTEEDDDDALPTPAPVAPPPAPVPTPPAPVETPPEAPVPAPPPAPVATGEIAVPGAAVAGETPAPTLLNSRSLTGFPSVTVGYSIYEVRTAAAGCATAAAAWRSAGVAAARDTPLRL